MCEENKNKTTGSLKGKLKKQLYWMRKFTYRVQN